MLGLIRSKISNSEEKRRVLGNIFSLSFLQGANYILPLLTVPYLVRVLGPEYFGLLAFATATATYFVLLTDYGFNLSATRQIAININNQEKVAEIFSSVMIIKLILLLVSFFLMLFLVVFVNKFSQNWDVFLLTFGMVIGQALFPVWYFQGIEKMKYITYLHVGAKSFFTIFIFIIVKDREDYIYVPILNSLGFIVAGVASLYIVWSNFGIIIKIQSWGNIKYQIVEGWHVFISSIAVSMYTTSMTFILGLFSTNTIVGYFAAADKVIQAVKGLYVPVSQAIYPLIGKKINEDKKLGILLIKKIIKYVSTGMMLVSVFLFLLAGTVVDILLGEQYVGSTILLKIMAFLPFIVSLNNLYGIQTMLNLGLKKQFSYILLISALVGLLVSFALIPIYFAVGAAIALVSVEIMVTLLMRWQLKGIL